MIRKAGTLDRGTALVVAEGERPVLGVTPPGGSPTTQMR
jgi:hypothetical protein